MNIVLRFIIFFSILVGAFYGLQYYIVRRLRTIFHLTYTYKIWIYFLATVLNFMTVTMLSRRIWNVGIQLWYFSSAVYVGGVWILFSFLLFHQLIHRFLPFSRKSTQYLLGISFGFLILFGIFNTYRLVVNTIEIPTEKKIEPMTIVQLSDFHLGAIHGKNFVDRVVSKTNALQPDIVVITGDLFDGSGKVSEETLQGFNNLVAPAFFILGNHDTYANGEKAVTLLKTTPIHLLRDEKTVYNERLQIIGLDYSEHFPGDDEISSILRDIPLDDRDFTLLLSHIPIDFSDFEQYPIDLALAGHTHGGQIFPFDLVIRCFYSHVKGLYQSSERYLYVSSGTGTWGPPMRLGSQSEITVFRIVPTSNSREDNA